MTDADELGIKIYSRAEKLRSARSSVFDPQWQQISQYFWPDVSDINTEKTENTDSWFDRIYETTGIRASSTCSIGVRNWLTPSTEPWLQLAPPYNLQVANGQAMNPRLQRLGSPTAPQANDNGMDEAQRWCAEVATQGLIKLQASSFYSVVQTFNRSACVFGTALMFLEKGKKSLFKFEQFKVGTYVIAENDEKIVDTVIRWFKLTVRQAVQKFCEKDENGKYDLSNLPEKMRKDYDKKNYDAQYKFLHHVYPNEDYQRGKLGKDGMAFTSIYQSEIDKKIIKEDGYEEMPYFCLRWSRWGTDDQPYGCSPAFEALAEERQLNFVTQFGDAKVELDAFPRLLYPDNLDGNVQLAAGAVTTFDHTKPESLPREWLTQGSNQSLAEMKQDKRDALNKAFFVDVFTALGQLDEKITQATYGAIALLKGEKTDQFTGTFDQYITEVINFLVPRMIGIMFRAGVLKEPPQSLMVQPDGDPKADPELAIPAISVNSRVTLALNEVKNVGSERTLQMLTPILEAGRTEILDNFDLDQWARNTARNNGVQESNIRSVKSMSEMRAQRAKMQQEQNALANAETAASAAGKLGKAPPGMQQQVMGRIGQAAA